MELVPLAVAVLGSTGVIGILTATVQLTRRARLTRAISAAARIADQAAPGSSTRLVLQQAIEMDMLRLAAVSIIKIRGREPVVWTGILVLLSSSLIIVSVAATVGLIDAQVPPWAAWAPTQDSVVRRWFVFAVMATYVAGIGAVLGMSLSLYRAREEFVTAAMLEQHPPVVTGKMRELARNWIEHVGPPLQRTQAPHRDASQKHESGSPS